MNFVKLIFLFSIAMLQISCKQTGIIGAEVTFSEIEKGVSEQITRMLVTKKFLRIDNGKNDNDFLLFDRTSRVIYSTNSMDKRTLVITAQSVNRKSPISLDNKIEKVTTDAPRIDGININHIKLKTNNRLCYDLYVANGLLPNVVAALREYRVVLAGEQAAVVDAIPKEMLSPCDLANNIFKPTRHLEHGFPVRLQETEGRFRELIEYKQGIKIDAELLKLPEEYTEFSPADIRNR